MRYTHTHTRERRRRREIRKKANVLANVIQCLHPAAPRGEHFGSKLLGSGWTRRCISEKGIGMSLRHNQTHKVREREKLFSMKAGPNNAGRGNRTLNEMLSQACISIGEYVFHEMCEYCV
jgi:hypothetical protein